MKIIESERLDSNKRRRRLVMLQSQLLERFTHLIHKKRMN